MKKITSMLLGALLASMFAAGMVRAANYEWAAGEVTDGNYEWAVGGDNWEWAAPSPDDVADAASLEG